MPRLLLLALVVALPALAVGGPASGGAASASSSPPAWEGRRVWASPVGGGVARAYDYDRGAPFARGAHRGVDLAARPGDRVQAPCSGTVTHAGRVPGHARGVTIACAAGEGAKRAGGAASRARGVASRARGAASRAGGAAIVGETAPALVATVLDLRTTAVAEHARVARGGKIGEAGGTSVHLGARRAADRFAYVEPPLATPPPDPAPFGPAPAPARRGRPQPAPPAPIRVVRPAPRPAPAPRGIPAPAWAGLALLAGAAPAGAITWRRRRAARRLPAPAA